MRIVEAVAATDDIDPLQLEPLYRVIDTDALSSLCLTDTDLNVTFEYNGHTVEVWSDGRVVVDGNTYRN